MPRFSVVIPLYNCEKYIGKCLGSLAAQEYGDFEVILVDDCSTDGSVAAAREEICRLGLKNVRILKNEVNLGPSGTRKKGIAQARGTYIAFCDSDDFMEKDHLKLLARATEDFTRDVVFFSYNSLYSNGNAVLHDMVSKIKGAAKKDILAHGTDSLCCLSARKEILDTVEFPDIRNGEDMAIIPVILARAESFGYVDKALYNYVYRTNSLSKRPDPEVAADLERSFDYIARNLGQDFPEETEYLGIKNLLYGAVLNLMKTAGGGKRARTLYAAFCRRYPNWSKNKYYPDLPKHKKLYLWCVKRRLFFLCRILSVIHQKVSK